MTKPRRLAAAFVVLVVVAGAAGACSNENHPPRDAKEATGLFHDIMTTDDLNECKRAIQQVDEPITFSITFVERVGPTGLLRVVIDTEKAPAGPNEAIGMNVTGTIHSADTNECDTVFAGTISLEHRAAIPPPKGAILADEKFFPTVVHSLWLPEQTTVNDPIEKLAGIDCADPKDHHLAESRLIEAHFFCRDEVVQ